MAEWHEKTKILHKGKVIFGFGLESNPRVITTGNEKVGFFVPLCHLPKKEINEGGKMRGEKVFHGLPPM